MALTYNVKAQAVTSNISNVESVIAGPIFLAAGAIAAGDALRVGLDSTLPKTIQFDVNLRIGANGNTSDAVFFSSNNIITQSVWFNDANAWAQTFPGLNTSLYPELAPYDKANFPAITQTPSKIKGELILVCTAVAAANTTNTANLALVVKPDRSVLDQENLLALLDNGNGQVIATGSFQSNVDNYFTVTSSISPATSLKYVGIAQGNANTPDGSLELQTGANSNGGVLFSIVETL